MRKSEGRPAPRQPVTAPSDATSPAPLESLRRAREQRARVGLNLFWRTFFLLALLLVGSILAWLQTLRALEFEPRTLHTAQQIASLVNLSRAALVHADAIARVSLIKTMADQEGVRILPREPGDKFTLLDSTALGNRLTHELTQRLGPDTIVAQNVNGENGLWVGFNINGDPNWLLMDRSRFSPAGGRTWLIWLITAGALSLAGAAAIARLINRPLKQLSYAANRVRDGDFAASRLDEEAVTSEIREVNIGFNRMAQKLAKLEQDRAVMLAGISHDLRTPLAKLRLAVEILHTSGEEELLQGMVRNITAADQIIDQFIDFARLDSAETPTVCDAEELLRDIVASFATSRLVIAPIAADLPLLPCRPVALRRAIANLLGNALKYSADEVTLRLESRAENLHFSIVDRGPGIPGSEQARLRQPFTRRAPARGGPAGAGLGLAIVERIMAQAGGRLALRNRPSGGLEAELILPGLYLEPGSIDPD